MAEKYRKNTLLKIVKIQNITLENTRKGITQTWVYNNLIKDQFFLSKRTYDRYLGVPAKKLLKDLYPNET
jgi:hypothetical protein